MKRLVASTVVLLVLAGCGHQTYKTVRGLGNVTWSARENSRAYVIQMPDHYANIATKCVGFGHLRVWVVSDGSALNWVSDDKTCPGGSQPEYRRSVVTHP